MKNYLKIYIRYSTIGFLMFAVVSFSVLKCHAQDTRKVRDEYIINGKPTFTPPTIPARSDDPWNKLSWKFENKTVGWILETDSAIIKVRLGLSEKGDKGDPGICPNCPPSGGVFPFIIVIPNGTDDTQALQAAIAEQKLTNKPIYPIGTVEVSAGLRFAKDNKRPTIIGGTFVTLNNNPYAVIGSDVPTSTADAEFYVERVYEIRNVTIICGTNQIGIAPGPNKGSLFEGNLINGGAAGLYNRFALNGTANRNEFLGQAYPTVTAHGAVLPLPGILANYGSWTNATTSNSCSNVFTFNHNRVYSNGTTINAHTAYASDGIYHYDGINEGLKIFREYVFDALGSTTCKRAGVVRSHHETVIPSTDIVNEAMVWCRMPSGQLDVVNCIGHYALVMINAGGTVGTLNVSVEKNQWWVPSGSKWFYNASAGGNTAWSLTDIENFGSDPSIVPGTFAGTPVKVWNGSTPNPGNNSVYFRAIPR